MFPIFILNILNNLSPCRVFLNTMEQFIYKQEELKVDWFSPHFFWKIKFIMEDIKWYPESRIWERARKNNNNKKKVCDYFKRINWQVSWIHVWWDICFWLAIYWKRMIDDWYIYVKPDQTTTPDYGTKCFLSFFFFPLQTQTTTPEYGTKKKKLSFFMSASSAFCVYTENEIYKSC